MSDRPVLISACLLGVPCRFDGQSKANAKALSLAQSKGCRLIPFCPECYGGLPIPRPPAEQRGDRVYSALGLDVTEQYERGAKSALQLCRLLGCKAAILKARSPSCGSGRIYDGTFSKTLISGDGITARLLKENGVLIFTEEDL